MMNNLRLKALRPARLFIPTNKQFATRLHSGVPIPGHQKDSVGLGSQQPSRVILPGSQPSAENRI